MSDLANGLIYVEKPQQCDFCGDIAELRPYGPNGEIICFPCAKKDPKATERKMKEAMGG